MKSLTNALTERGMLKTSVAANIKGQGRAKLAELGFVTMPNGRMALQVAEADGKVITLNVDLTVGCDTNFERKAKAKAHKEEDSVEVPDLF